MSLRLDVAKLKELLAPKAKLEIKIIYSLDDVTHIDNALWILFNI